MTKPADISQSAWDSARGLLGQIDREWLLPDRADEQVVETVARAIDEAVAEQREKDAMIADSFVDENWNLTDDWSAGKSFMAEEIADQIRKAEQ